MSKLLSYFLVENKDQDIVFKKQISQKSSSSANTLHTKGNNPMTASAPLNQNIKTNNQNNKSTKLDCKRQLKLTQLLQNLKQNQPTVTSTSPNPIIKNQTSIKNSSNLHQQQRVVQQIPLPSQVSKQNQGYQLTQELSPLCSFTFELKGGVARQTQHAVVEKQKKSLLNLKSIQLLPSYCSYDDNEIETQLTSSESPSPSSPSIPQQLFSSGQQKKNALFNAKRKVEDTLVSEFEISFSKKRSIPEFEESFEASPELEEADYEHEKRARLNKRKFLSFKSQNECADDNEEYSLSSSNETLQHIQDVFTCTETLSPNGAALDECLDSELETQTTELARSNSKLSLKNRLKMIDSVKKQSPEEELQEFEDSIGINKFEKELNYQQEYLENLIKLERDYSFDSSVYKKQDCQIDSNMRCVVVNWIFELCSDYRLSRQTSQTAINLFDRYLAKKYTQISKSNIQLVAATCVYISSKKEEQVSPKLKEFIDSTKNSFTVAQFLTQELDILNTLNFKINAVCFEEWLHNICQRWDEFINEKLDLSTEQNSKIYFSKKSEDSKMRYVQLQKAIDLLQLDCEFNKHKKSVIVLALIYVNYGIYSQDFLLDDVVNYFPSISKFYQKDYFQAYNACIQSFKDRMFNQNTSISSHFKEDTFIQAIQFVSKFFGYFKQPCASSNMKNLIESNQRQFLLENGLEFVQNQLITTVAEKQN